MASSREASNNVPEEQQPVSQEPQHVHQVPLPVSQEPQPVSQERYSTSQEHHPTSQEHHPTSQEEDVKMKKLRSTFDTLVDRVLDSVSFRKFRKYYKDIVAHAPLEMKSVHKQFDANVRKHIREEFELFLTEINMEEKLKRLHELLDEQQLENPDDDVIAWRPSGDPETDLLPHLIPFLTTQKTRLEQMLSTVELDNAKLSRLLILKRKQVHEERMRVIYADADCKQAIQRAEQLTSQKPAS